MTAAGTVAAWELTGGDERYKQGQAYQTALLLLAGRQWPPSVAAWAGRGAAERQEGEVDTQESAIKEGREDSRAIESQGLNTR